MIGRVGSAIRRAVGAWLGAPSAPAPALALPASTATAPAPSPPRAKRRKRRASQQPIAQTRWYQRDVESAQHLAAQGNLTIVGRLCRAFGRDGYAIGLLSVRAGGLVRLPKRFTGDPEAVAFLQGPDGKGGAFKRAFPSTELEMMDRDGFTVGAAVAEFLDLDTVPVPVLCRLDPEFLSYSSYEDAWYYQSTSGRERVEPGNGRWVLHLRGGRAEPWNNGIWPAVARAYISKEHSFFLRENWLTKLANAARAAVSPQGASEEQQQSWFQKVMAWGVNTVFGMRPGYDVKMIESNGRGHESFPASIKDANAEMMVAVSGSTVLVDGGSGFSNIDAHKAIRSDLLQADGESLSDTLNEQGIPWVLEGHVPIGSRAQVEWDTRPPADVKAEAEALSAAAKAITETRAALLEDGIPLNTRALCARFAVPVEGDIDGDAVPDAHAAPVPPAALPAPAGDTTEPEREMAGDAGDAPPEDGAVAALAEKMTSSVVARCEHGRANRCWLCGIERVRDFEVDDQGQPVWRVVWRPIAQGAVA